VVAVDALPAVRAELRLVGSRRDASGGEVHVVYDPVRHRFFEFAPLAARMLAHWRSGSRATVAERSDAQPEEVDDMVRFLGANQLLRAAPKPPQLSAWQRIEHLIGSLFFFRIPLVRPDRFLALAADLLAPVMGRRALAVLLGLTATAALLVGRQWDLFVAGFRPSLNLGGAVAMMAAVAVAKAIHELGHALAAKRMGCRVPAMGVAVMFGAPLLYTDLSDSWRLDKRRQRLLVASGGILAELVVAAAASWGWLILPDGPARGACLFLATAAWVATLVVNLNPFMRFDGYFMLSALLGVPNLQPRAFALGRWRLRRLLFAGDEPCPDDAPRTLARIMVAYAWSTWAFRGSLYLGLAFAVFHMLPKVVATPLLAAELWVLVARPVVLELAEWWRRRRDFARTPRGRFTLGLAALLLLWAAVPQRFDLALPAVAAPAERQWVYPPRPAMLDELAAEGTVVAAGAVVARFHDPDLDYQLGQSRLRLSIAVASEEQAARTLRSARELAVLRERIATERATLAGLEAQQATLTVTAPFAGRVVEAPPGRRPGLWLPQSEPLFLLTSAEGRQVTAFVDDRDLDLLEAGTGATFYPTAIDLPVMTARVAAVETVPSETIAEPMLASITGGAIATERDAAGRAVPRHGQYRVTAMPTDASMAQPVAVEGRLLARSRPYSLLGLAWRRLRALMVKEATS
jgi:putative peptide zinc metalloprotease protein